MLVSRIIDSIIKDRQPTEGFAYFYCNREEQSRRETVWVLQSLVKQLASPLNDDKIHQTLVDIYNAKKESGFASNTLSEAEAEELLHEIFLSYRKTTIIIDALDECERNFRYSLMERLVGFTAGADVVKVIVASRRNDDIDGRLRREGDLGIEAMDNQKDIQTFVLRRLELDAERRVKESSRLLSPDLKELIASTLLERSQGM